MPAIKGYFVLHAAPSNFRETTGLQMMDKSEGKTDSKKRFGELLDAEDGYRPVAFVHNVPMERVFELTNNIDDLWVKNKDHVVSLTNEEGLRSTSVGDVIIDPQAYKVFAVSDFGFTELDDAFFDKEALLEKSISVGKAALDRRHENDVSGPGLNS